jgi:hypothetical protein
MLANANSDPNFLNTLITSDEMWFYGYDPETKMQSSQWIPEAKKNMAGPQQRQGHGDRFL